MSHFGMYLGEGRKPNRQGVLACGDQVFKLVDVMMRVVVKARARRAHLRFWRWFYAAWALILLIGLAESGRAADPDAVVLDQRFSTQSGPAENPSPGAAELKAGLKKQVRKMAQAPELGAPPVSSGTQLTLVWALVLAAAFGVARLGPGAARRWHRRLALPAGEDDLAVSALAENPSMGEFFSALQAGSDLAPAAALPRVPGSQEPAPGPAIEAQTPAAPDPLQASLGSARKHLAILRARFSELISTQGDAERLRLVHAILEQVRVVKQRSRLPELRPIWLMVFALEGLLKQVSRKAAYITPSALRTISAAVDLLEALCVPNLRSDLATNPPVRLLAVDDDPLSRRAISLALKKAFYEPDLAPEGQRALALATQQSYDVIFLDVEMPGMDGFELCSKIRETVPNRTTPVVFITIRSDFDSRVKSTLLGAHDLIAKPFLIFEITVKTLTLVLKSRLKASGSEPPVRKIKHSAPTAPDQVAAGAPTASIGTPQPLAGCQPAPQSSQPRGSANRVNKTLVRHSDAGTPAVVSGPAPIAASATPGGFCHDETAGASQPSSSKFAGAFFTRVPYQLQALRQQLAFARAAAQPADGAELLCEISLGVRAMNCEAGDAGLGAVLRVGSALQAMLKKLLEEPTLRTPPTFDAAATALDTLDELCQARTDLDPTRPPARLLVVDDDPVSRRGISGALQLAFGRPDSADSGETALALAWEKRYDLIFLDVIMSGLDGFTTCDSLHHTALNSHTPVVFVTGRDGAKPREQAVAAGGCGFIPKPVLASQIKLVALCFIFRARLANQVSVTATAGLPAPTDRGAVEAGC